MICACRRVGSARVGAGRGAGGCQSSEAPWVGRVELVRRAWRRGRWAGNVAGLRVPCWFRPPHPGRSRQAGQVSRGSPLGFLAAVIVGRRTFRRTPPDARCGVRRGARPVGPGAGRRGPSGSRSAVLVPSSRSRPAAVRVSVAGEVSSASSRARRGSTVRTPRRRRDRGPRQLRQFRPDCPSCEVLRPPRCFSCRGRSMGELP